MSVVIYAADKAARHLARAGDPHNPHKEYHRQAAVVCSRYAEAVARLGEAPDFTARLMAGLARRAGDMVAAQTLDALASEIEAGFHLEGASHAAADI